MGGLRLVAARLKGTFAPKALGSVRVGIRALYSARVVADYHPRASVRDSLAIEALQKATAIANNVRKVKR